MQRLLSRFILRCSAACKPVLVKLAPISFLRKVKAAIIAKNLTKLERGKKRAFLRGDFPDGINLLGYIRGEIGLGQSCRLVASALSGTGRPFTIYNYDQVSAMRSTDASWDEKVTNTAPYNINLIHINPYELAIARLQLPESIWEGRYNIAFWLWELEEFPDEWCPCFSLLDEIWTPAEFVSESIRKKTSLPVRTIPYAISAPADEAAGRAFFGLPEDCFLFLCMYDCNSTMERKNPLGAIDAFTRAFPGGCAGRVGLVVKVNNPQQRDLDILQKKLQNYRDVYFITEILSKKQVNSLIACADVFISLHRAEGFGLVPAEAMLLGTPVVATNWSANTEFMTHETSCLVDCDLVPIERDCGPYKAGNRWAEPDVAQAAGYLQRLYQDKEFYRATKARAQEHIREQLSLERASGLINKRLEEIYEQHGAY